MGWSETIFKSCLTDIGVYNMERFDFISDKRPFEEGVPEILERYELPSFVM